MNHEKIKHIDLFSGIGGFSLAVDRVFGKENISHTFVEWDDFCQEVLKKHWPEAQYHKDIKQFITDTDVERRLHRKSKIKSTKQSLKTLGKPVSSIEPPFLLTGGFPCQPFSQAGRRKGTDDNRYLWPAMLECISLFKPQWVIAENVGGLVTWNEGLVLETVCSDLEKEGYEVQPFIIPAVAVGAPHRRDRVWIVANRRCKYGKQRRDEGVETNTTEWTSCKSNSERCCENDSNSNSQRQSRNGKGGTCLKGQFGLSSRKGNKERSDSWQRNWTEVATELCRMDDGIPKRLDRNPRLKSLGNAIVSQVAEEIIKRIALLK